MLSKFKVIAVFVLIAGMLGIVIGTRLFYSQKQYKLENLPYGSITSIKLFDNGLVGENTINFTNKDSISLLTRLILTSKPVQRGDIDFHETRGLCDIVMHCSDGKVLLLSFYKAPLTHGTVMDGFVSSGDFHYRNDALLVYLERKFGTGD